MKKGLLFGLINFLLLIIWGYVFLGFAASFPYTLRIIWPLIYYTSISSYILVPILSIPSLIFSIKERKESKSSFIVGLISGILGILFILYNIFGIVLSYIG